MKRKFPIITPDQMREVDRLMIEEYHISLDQMMENAGRCLADLAMDHLNSKSINLDECNIICFCGPGHNGGGGLTAVRFLWNRGINIACIIAGQEKKMKPIPKTRMETLRKMNVDLIHFRDPRCLYLLQKADLVLDAIIGYGLSGAPRDIQKECIQMIRDCGSDVISLDIPSGLNSTNGTAYTPCVHADKTLTLALPKTGLLKGSTTVVGKLYVADIGVPVELYVKIGLLSVPRFISKMVVEYDS